MTPLLGQDHNLRGILCVACGGLLLTCSDTIIKWVSDTYPLHEIVFIRSLIGIILIGGLIKLEGGLGLLRTKRPGMHFFRGLVLVIANMCYFLGLASMQLAEAAAIFFCAPLFITILAGPVLGEKVGIKRWLAVLVGLIGVIIMLHPGSGVFQPVGLFPLAAAFAYAIMQVSARAIGVTERASVMMFYGQATFVVFCLMVGMAIGDGYLAGSDDPTHDFMFRAWSWPQGMDWLFIIICGFFISAGGYFITQGYRLSQVNVAAPFEYVALPLAVLLGYLLWGDLPDVSALLGIIMIVGSGIYVVYRERSKKQNIVTNKELLVPPR